MTKKLILGDKENRLLLTLEESKATIFSFKDAKKILKTSIPSVNNILLSLTRKNCIQRIENGKYLLVPAIAGYEKHWTEEPWVILPRIINEYYVGFWSAMNYWGMTEQIPNTVFVITTKRKRNLKFGYQKIQFVTFSKKKFFGFIEETRGKTKFNISTKEKTIVDGLMFPQYCGKISEVAKAMWNSRNEINWEIVLQMVKRLEVNVVLRRLGYLLTLLEIKDSANNIIEKIKKEQFNGFLLLDPTGTSKKVEYSKEYGLIINRTKRELLEWMQY